MHCTYWHNDKATAIATYSKINSLLQAFYNCARSILKRSAILTAGVKSTGDYSCTLEMITNKSLTAVAIVFSAILRHDSSTYLIR